MQDVPNFIFVEDPTETPQQTIARFEQDIGKRIGCGRPLELVLPDIMLALEGNWRTLITDNFKSSWIPQLKGSPLLGENPDLGPMYPETFIQNVTDGPNKEIPLTRSSIRYNIMKTENAGFKRKMFSDIKELRPRRRYFIAKDLGEGLLEYTEVKVKTNEHDVYFYCYGRNGMEAEFLFKCMEYILYTNAKLFLEFGIQRAISLGSPSARQIDRTNRMHIKILRVYFRTEEYFYTPPVKNISGLDLQWQDIQTTSI